MRIVLIRLYAFTSVKSPSCEECETRNTQNSNPKCLFWQTIGMRTKYRNNKTNTQNLFNSYFAKLETEEKLQKWSVRTSFSLFNRLPLQFRCVYRERDREQTTGREWEWDRVRERQKIPANGTHNISININQTKTQHTKYRTPTTKTCQPHTHTHTHRTRQCFSFIVRSLVFASLLLIQIHQTNERINDWTTENKSTNERNEWTNPPTTNERLTNSGWKFLLCRAVALACVLCYLFVLFCFFSCVFFSTPFIYFTLPVLVLSSIEIVIVIANAKVWSHLWASLFQFT